MRLNFLRTAPSSKIIIATLRIVTIKTSKLKLFIILYFNEQLDVSLFDFHFPLLFFLFLVLNSIVSTVSDYEHIFNIFRAFSRLMEGNKDN